MCFVCRKKGKADRHNSKYDGEENKSKRIDNSFIGNYNIILEKSDTFDSWQGLILD